MFFTSLFDKRMSLRFRRVTFPDSRELKWSCPAFLFRTFLFLVILNLLTVALCVFSFPIVLDRNVGSPSLTAFVDIRKYKKTGKHLNLEELSPIR